MLALPIIVNPAAALQILAEFFETYSNLTNEDFVRLLRKSQGLDELHDNRRGRGRPPLQIWRCP